MSLQSPPVRTHTTKPGTCPHGMPIGACPICNGMAGGNSTSKRNIPRNVGEMSYNQCAAIGALLKAQKATRESAKQAQENHLQALIDFQKNITSTQQRLIAFATLINNNMPKIISLPMTFILTQIGGNILRFIQHSPIILNNFLQNFQVKLTDITDKLAAIYGEIKNAVNDNLAKFLSSVKKKLKFSFLVFGSHETDDEEEKAQESKRIFELKTIIHKLQEKIKYKIKKEQKKDEH